MSDLDFGLGCMADTTRETTARFAADRIAPIAAPVDAEDSYPRELWREIGALGLHGITVDETDGGLGLGYLEHVIACEEVSRASASVGLSYGAHSNLCANQIRRWANPEQKAKYLPGLISGDHVGRLALSEAGAGSGVVSGGAGYSKDWPVERYWRDAKPLDIGAGTNEIRRMLIGRELINDAQ